ncbi:MAG: polyphosphate polymerase domain-containing protein [Thermodesulfobacteriota bacterium]
MKAKLHFSRFEFKYILPTKRKEELERELRYFMALDPYVSARRRQKYFVRSLYFDDDVLTNYYEKTDGVMVRRKYRIRTYTDDRTEECVFFLEVKGRYNALVYKHRTPIARSFVDRLEHSHREFVEGLIDIVDQSEVIQGFLFDCFRMRLRPTALVDYERRPYVSRYAPDFRITFDDALESTYTKTLFSGPVDRRRIFLPGYSIVEVKFGRHIPSWFHRLIQSYELRRVSVSKYCRSMEQLGKAQNLE